MTDLTATSHSELLPRADERRMLATIAERMPEIAAAISQQGRTQTQTMDCLLTLDKITPLRNARQVLAEMNKAIAAMREASVACRRKQVEAEIAEEAATEEDHPLRKQLHLLDAERLRGEVDQTSLYYAAAVRKVAHLMHQYDALLESAGVSEFSEADLEADEERYHIMTAFRQALIAARARGGLIDEGNLIYMSQIGINGGMAQRHVSAYLAAEDKAVAGAEDGSEVSYACELNFLRQMAERYAGCGASKAATLGLDGPVTPAALLAKAGK